MALGTPDYRGGFSQLRARLENHLGIRISDSAIPDDMGFREWCEHLAEHRGLKVDGKPFRLDNRPALVPIYDAIPTTAAEAFKLLLVIQKATQLGLTVWEVLANLYLAKKFHPVTIGMFLPDQATASYKSEHRFMRLIRSVPELHREMTHRADEEGKVKRVGDGNVLTRTLGESLFLFLWTSGKVSTESRPMDIVTLDEVQEMSLAEIDKVRARTGDSDLQMTMMLSTANMPDLDINFWYQLGTQEVWHSECSACGTLSDLSDPAGIFPEKSVTFNRGQVAGAPVGEYVWTCPACAAWIPDPQFGRPVVCNPGAADLIAAGGRIRSFLLPRTISPRMTPGDMIGGWGRAKTGDQKKSFYNRTLGRPYIDADQLPVTMAHCEAAAAEGMRLGLVWEHAGEGTFMGIDQMGGFNAVIIKRRLPDGRQAVVWVEAIFGADPFADCDVLMARYGVSICVVEQLPNVNDARRFANRHPGRVFLAGYADLRDDFMTWGDDLSKSDRKTADEERTRYTVTLNQYKCMQASLYRVRGEMVEGRQVPMCLFPDPSALEQDVVEDGVTLRRPIVRDWVFVHLTKTALVIEQNEEERKPRGKVVKIGIDPHYAFANMLCDVAWARSHGTSTVFLPGGPASHQELMDRGAAAGMPGLNPAVVKMMETLPPGQVCGRCVSFDAKTGRCGERSVMVAAKDPGCDWFVAKS